MAQVQDTEPKPTRPSWKMAVVVLGIIVVAETAYHWPQLSKFAHMQKIEQSLGIG